VALEPRDDDDDAAMIGHRTGRCERSFSRLDESSPAAMCERRRGVVNFAKTPEDFTDDETTRDQPAVARDGG